MKSVAYIFKGKIYTYFFSWVVFLLLYHFSAFSQENLFSIKGKVNIEDDNFSNLYVSLFKNSTFVQTIAVEEYGFFEYNMEYDADYLLTFHKKGYITKDILISTMLPHDFTNRDFESFIFQVSLQKQHTDADTIYYGHPVAKIKYNEQSNQFDYDMDYSLQSKSKSTKTVQEIQEDSKKEIEKQKEQKNLLELQNQIARYKAGEKNTLSEDEYHLSDLNTLFPDRKNIQIIDETEKKITIIIINNHGKIDFFKMVNYKWGGTFFFKNDKSISQTIFEQETM